MPIERKLAAIMFTDIAGYTALSAKDETKALELLDTQKQILTPIIEEFHGTLHNRVGDGLLFTFPAVTDAIKCGIKIQKETKEVEDLNLRIGIHEGEITLKNGDALGDDVNVASRIDPFSAEGGIVISGKVQQNISSLPEFKTKFISEPLLKGVSQEVKVFCIISHGLPETDITKVTAKLEKDVKKLWQNQKFIIGTIGLLVFTVLLFVGYENDLWYNKEKINQNAIIDIFIVGVQSHKEEIDATETIFREHIKNTTNVSELDHISFLQIKDSELLEKLYSEVLISSTSEFYQKHNLISNQDMQKTLASSGKTMNFNELPNYHYVQSKSEENLDLNVMHEYYSPAINLLDESIEGNNGMIIMFNVHAFEIQPSVAGKNIIGIIDIFDISKQETSDGEIDHKVNYGSIPYIAESKSFGDDVTKNIGSHIDRFLFSKFPSTVITENNNKVIIKVNNSARPQKFSKFSLKRIYDCSNLDNFHEKKINEYEDMFVYCDTTSNAEVSKSCDDYLDNKLGGYIFSMDEYNDLINNNHPVKEGANYALNLPLGIVIQEVFDTTAIGIIGNNNWPWFKLEKGDQLILE